MILRFLLRNEGAERSIASRIMMALFNVLPPDMQRRVSADGKSTVHPAGDAGAQTARRPAAKAPCD
jgi:hypothetical protein